MSRPGAFVVPRDGAPYLKVRLDFELIAARRCGNGFGYVNASAGSGPSASVVQAAVRQRWRVLRWSTSRRPASAAGRALAPRRRVGHELHAHRRRAAGRHELSFSLETAKGFHVKGVRIRPTSGLRPTHEPPYTVALDIDPHEARTVPGEPVVIDVQYATRVPRRRGRSDSRSSRAPMSSCKTAASSPDGPRSSPERRAAAPSPAPQAGGSVKVDVAVESSKGSTSRRSHWSQPLRRPPPSAPARATPGGSRWPPLGVWWSAVPTSATGATARRAPPCGRGRTRARSRPRSRPRRPDRPSRPSAPSRGRAPRLRSRAGRPDPTDGADSDKREDGERPVASLRCHQQREHAHSDHQRAALNTHRSISCPSSSQQGRVRSMACCSTST